MPNVYSSNIYMPKSNSLKSIPNVYNLGRGSNWYRGCCTASFLLIGSAAFWEPIRKVQHSN